MQQKELDKYYREKTNLRLKYAAVISITIAVILMIAMVIWLDSISAGMLLFMRGVLQKTYGMAALRRPNHRLYLSITARAVKKLSSSFRQFNNWLCGKPLIIRGR